MYICIFSKQISQSEKLHLQSVMCALAVPARAVRLTNNTFLLKLNYFRFFCLYYVACGK